MGGGFEKAYEGFYLFQELNGLFIYARPAPGVTDLSPAGKRRVRQSPAL